MKVKKLTHISGRHPCSGERGDALPFSVCL